jgi:competence protein ComEA
MDANSPAEAKSEANVSPDRPEMQTTSSPDPTNGPVAHRDQITLWLRRTDQWLLGILLISLLVLLVAFRLKLSGWSRSEIEIVSQQPREYFYTLDVNKASWVEWAQLDGIGEKLARRIVKDREDRGPFKSIEDLRRIRGLGPKLIEKLRPFLRCAEPERG